VSLKDVDVFVVQKQTAIERYTKRNLSVDFFEYLERDGQNLTRLADVHNTHMKARHALAHSLESRGISFQMCNLDDLIAFGVGYFDGEKGGLQPKRNLVISLGGDGTLLHASHHCGGKVALLGINSCPDHSVGHLCAVNSYQIEEALDRFEAGRLEMTPVSRIRVKTESNASLPLALNDVLLCHKHPAATSRYQLSVHNTDEGTTVSEKHKSSGVWVATPAGATAAIATYGLPPPPFTAREFLFAVREIYTPPGESYSLLRQTLDGKVSELSFFCRMRQGLVCIDGPDSQTELGFGESIHISMPEVAQLLLALPASKGS
jgi:NAD+ kinase